MNDPNSVRPDTHTVIVAFALVFGAGMATAIGASVVVFLPKLISSRSNAIMNRYVLASSLGMSAGVMIYVSMIEIFQKSRLAFIAAGYAENIAYVYATLCFFAGVCIMMVRRSVYIYNNISLSRLTLVSMFDGHVFLIMTSSCSFFPSTIDFERVGDLFFTQSPSASIPRIATECPTDTP